MKFTTKEKINAEMTLRRLSNEAFKIYSDTDPLTVYERDGLLYSSGVIDANGVTLNEFEKMLIDLWEEC